MENTKSTTLQNLCLNFFFFLTARNNMLLHYVEITLFRNVQKKRNKLFYFKPK